jgi:hypothetical protein
LLNNIARISQKEMIQTNFIDHGFPNPPITFSMKCMLTQ